MFQTPVTYRFERMAAAMPIRDPSAPPEGGYGRFGYPAATARFDQDGVLVGRPSFLISAGRRFVGTGRGARARAQRERGTTRREARDCG